MLYIVKDQTSYLCYKNQDDLMSLFRSNFSLYLLIMESIKTLFPDI